MRTCGWCLELSVFFLVSFVFYLVSPFFFQPFLMSNSAINERSMSNPQCYSSLGSVVTSDYVTPLTVIVGPCSLLLVPLLPLAVATHVDPDDAHSRNCEHDRCSLCPFGHRRAGRASKWAKFMSFLASLEEPCNDHTKEAEESEVHMLGIEAGTFDKMPAWLTGSREFPVEENSRGQFEELKTHDDLTDRPKNISQLHSRFQGHRVWAP